MTEETLFALFQLMDMNKDFLVDLIELKEGLSHIVSTGNVIKEEK
jgi:hypothetical protein